MKTKTNQNQQTKKGVYMNPVTDFGFKYIFEDEKILTPFIEDVLGIKIQHLEYLNNEELGQTPEEKKIIYDLLCRDGDGNEFIVEMQNRDQVFFSDRIVYYQERRSIPMLRHILWSCQIIETNLRRSNIQTQRLGYIT